MNSAKHKSWKGLEMENAHMRAHLKKTTLIYQQAKA